MKTIYGIAALQALNSLEGKSLPLRFAYSAARNRRLLIELADVYEKKRKELLNQYGMRDEKNELVVKEGNVELMDPKAFADGMNVLNFEEVDPGLIQIPIADFPENIEMGIIEALIAAEIVKD